MARNQDQYEWNANRATGAPGWYAVVVIWDENEGMSPSAARWTGTAWEDERPIAAFHGPHESEDAADEWAREHDPEL